MATYSDMNGKGYESHRFGICKNLQLIYESQDVLFWCVFQFIVKYGCVLSGSHFQSWFSVLE